MTLYWQDGADSSNCYHVGLAVLLSSAKRRERLQERKRKEHRRRDSFATRTPKWPLFCVCAAVEKKYCLFTLVNQLAKKSFLFVDKLLGSQHLKMVHTTSSSSFWPGRDIQRQSTALPGTGYLGGASVNLWEGGEREGEGEGEDLSSIFLSLLSFLLTLGRSRSFAPLRSALRSFLLLLLPPSSFSFCSVQLGGGEREREGIVAKWAYFMPKMTIWA